MGVAARIECAAYANYDERRGQERGQRTRLILHLFKGIAQRSGHAGDQVVPSTGVLSQVSLTGTNGGLEVNWTFSTGVPIPTLRACLHT